MKRQNTNKAKYLLNVNGTKYKADTMGGLLWRFITGKSIKKR